MTRRMVAAVRNPLTNVLGHCTGRLVTGNRGTRGQSEFDAEAVFEACAETGTAVEINARPERRDPPTRLLQQAIDIGCLFSIDSDAHAPGPARLPGLRLRPRRGARPGPRPHRQHLADRAAAGVGAPVRCCRCGRASFRSHADPEVEVRRSRRRTRTVSAYRRDGKVVVMIPDRFTRAEEDEWVTTMLDRLERSEQRGAAAATTS